MKKRFFFCALLASSASSWAITIDTLQQHVGLEFTEELKAQMMPMFEDYNSSQEQRAIAIAIDDEGDVSFGYAFSSLESAASGTALKSCEEERHKHIDVAAPCEIVYLNDTAIPTASMLKAPFDGDDPSFIWEVTGGQTTVYVGGTIHIMKPAMYPLNDAFRKAYDETQQLAVEVNMLLQETPERARAIAPLLYADPQAVRASMSEDLLAKLADFCTANGIPLESQLQLQPSITGVNIAAMKMIAMGYDPQSGIDLHFLRRATADRKPIIELESGEDQIRLLTSLDLAAQSRSLELTFEQMDSANEFLAKSMKLWLSGDAEGMYHATADEFADEALTAFGKRMLDDRNHAMSRRIIDFLKGNTPTMVIVGAAHYGGPEGILALLRKAGYEPRQLARNGISGRR